MSSCGWRTGPEGELPMKHGMAGVGAIDEGLLLSGRLGDHSQCVAVSELFRGKLCEELGRRRARQLDSGEFLYHMGEAARSVYLMRSGLIKTSMISPGGHELTLRIHRAGDILGELCLCADERREQAVALEESEVVEIPLDLLIARLRRDREAALDFATAASEHLLQTYQRLQSLSVEPAMGRLTRTLLDLAADLGEPTAHGTQIGHHITQEELARLISARREVVSSLLNELRKTGLISYTRRGLSSSIARRSRTSWNPSVRPESTQC
jgi:CRP/FNR family transcriptional regulator, cyclic AMP receptor protein